MWRIEEDAYIGPYFVSIDSGLRQEYRRRSKAVQPLRNSLLYRGDAALREDCRPAAPMTRPTALPTNWLCATETVRINELLERKINDRLAMAAWENWWKAHA